MPGAYTTQCGFNRPCPSMIIVVYEMHEATQMGRSASRDLTGIGI